MEKKFLLALIMLVPFILNAQEVKKEKKAYGIKFGGFIKSDYWLDTRQVASAREGIFALFPLNESFDKAGDDINAKNSFNFTAMTSRLTGRISAPDAFGAKTSGALEADFAGMSNSDNNGFRLRLAFGKLSWDKTELLIGQFWHPMFVTEVFPRIVSLNTGAPFQPFIRSPQIRLTKKFGDIKLIAAALTQRDYTSNGPFGRSSIYLRNSVVPNFHLQTQYKSEKIVTGVAVDYKILQPRTITESNLITNETLETYAIMGYGKYKASEKFCLRYKSVFGQNMTEHLMLGGYAVKSRDTVAGYENYTSTNHFSSWINISYGKDIQLGFLGGYSKNLGTSDDNIGEYFATGSNIDYLYRLSPSISFVSNKMQISTELEYTVAAYGTPDIKGLVQDTKEIANIRLLCRVMYFF